MAELQIMYSAGGQFYAIADVARECGLWLSVAKHPLPVPAEWRRPGLTFAAVMRGRDYYRIGAYAPQNVNRSAPISSDDECVRDYRDAAWWTPGLEEAWVELQGSTRRSEAKPSKVVYDVRTAEHKASDSKRDNDHHG
jgi:hypothetical protein